MTVSLDATLNGLKVAQQALDTVSTNISNAGTVGYTRKVLPQETMVIAGSAVGVHATLIKRTVDTALIGDVMRQTSVANAASVLESYYTRIQDFHGTPGSGKALSDQIGKLSDSFTQLSLSPNDATLLNQVVLTAQQTASKINNFATLLSDLRRQTESDINAAVSTVNQNLSIIAQLNVQISSLTAGGKSTADLEDKRDMAINEVAKYLQVSTFKASNGSLYVMTKQGQVLADNAAHPLYFSQSNILPTSYYPDGGLSGIYAGSASGVDITQTNLGGQIGALLEMRDETLPQYTAQLDEFAQKLAERFDSQGLRLFTDGNGNVPPSAADPDPVTYVGFSSMIQVNSAVVANNALIRHGTTGGTEQTGSNEVINRITAYALGSYQYQQAAGTIDITAYTDLAADMGLTVTNSVAGTVSLAGYAPNISTLPNATFPGDFDLTLGGSTQTITVESTDTAQILVDKINTAFGETVARINTSGQIAIQYAGDIEFADNSIGVDTMNALGFDFGVTAMPRPSFQVQVGTRAIQTITLNPNDTSVELLDALNDIEGLTATLGDNGELILRPTDGGALKVLDGPGAPLAAMGVTVANIAHTPLRQNNLGPDGSVSTGLLANSGLHDYVASIISDQSQDAALNAATSATEGDYLATLETRNSNISGVNIDQEMAELIRIQSAYAASAKTLTAIQNIFQDLLDAV